MTPILAPILDIAMLPGSAIPQLSRQMARFSLFDWIVCGLAGADEPVARALRALADAEGGTPEAALFGAGRAPARMAALVNGAASHALDYDDTHFAHVGHMSVGVFPAALATGEACGSTAANVVDAFLIGAEAAIRIGVTLGRGHYVRGFHQTATAGAFGAAIAAGRLLNLDRDAMRVAIGLCATRASGLRCQFGTMGKPYNAGIAASAGVECALLAKAGFTAPDDGLTGPGGFVATHSDAPGNGFETTPPDHWLFDDIKYKLHACCHGTHAMIEALNSLLAEHRLAPDDVDSLHLRTNPRWMSVCDIKAPRTGLEVKFSYPWLAGMVLSGISTGSDRSYTDAGATDPAMATFAKRVTVTGDDSVSDMQAEGEITTRDGRHLSFSHDLAAPLPPERIAQGLRAKADELIGDHSARISEVLERLDTLSARDLGALLEKQP